MAQKLLAQQVFKHHVAGAQTLGKERAGQVIADFGDQRLAQRACGRHGRAAEAAGTVHVNHVETRTEGDDLPSQRPRIDVPAVHLSCPVLDGRRPDLMDRHILQWRARPPAVGELPARHQQRRDRDRRLLLAGHDLRGACHVAGADGRPEIHHVKHARGLRTAGCGRDGAGGITIRGRLALRGGLAGCVHECSDRLSAGFHAACTVASASSDQPSRFASRSIERNAACVWLSRMTSIGSK